MSMNENLEVKVSELTNVIKGLSDKPFVSSTDVNNLVNNLIQKVEDTNEAGLNKLANDLSESMFSVLEEKYNDINGRLSVFEEFVASVEKNIQNPKIENEITRVLNDIEALHSKMNSQELQTEGLLKSFDSFKGASGAGQITKICDEIVSISKSYDGIVEVLNENFQEFLRRVEALSSREELQRLRYMLESVEGNQNVLVSAMNAINDKQEEIKNLIKQSSSSQNTERLEQLQANLNRLNGLIIDTTSKADLEIIVDKISSLSNLLNEFKRSVDENNDNDIKNVFQGQLNNIISKLEGLKLDSNSNLNEDIIRLYTSIAEFKDGVYSAINTQLNDIIASMDVQFDKISNSVVNSTLDVGETVGNLTGEVQKLNSVVVEGLNSKALEIKQELQSTGRENVITVVNSIKGELSSLLNEISALNSNDGMAQLAHNIESLQKGIDIDSLIIQMDQIKSALNLEPIKEQLEILNKDETINTINQKIDLVLAYVKNGEVLSKLEELGEKTNPDRLYFALESINQKIDFTPLENKISDLKGFLSNTDFSGEINSIREKLNLIDNIGEELVSVKNIDGALFEIKNIIEENFKLNSDKITESLNFQNDIKGALKEIYELSFEIKENSSRNLTGEIKENLNQISNQISEMSAESGLNFQNAINTISGNLSLVNSKIEDAFLNNFQNTQNALDTINDNVNSISLKVNDSLQGAISSLEGSLNNLGDKISVVDSKLNNQDDGKLDEIKGQIEVLGEIVRSISSSPINEQLESLEQKVLTSEIETSKALKDGIVVVQNNILSNINSIRNLIASLENKGAENEGLVSLFDEFESRLNEKTAALETLVEETGQNGIQQNQSALVQEIAGLKKEAKESLSLALEEVFASKTEFLSDFIKAQLTEAKIEISNCLKQENEVLSSFFVERGEINEKEILTKIAQIIAARENSEARINFIKGITESLNEISGGVSLAKEGLEENKNSVKELNESVNAVISKLEEALSQKEGGFETVLGEINDKLAQMDSKISNTSEGERLESLLAEVNDKLTQTDSKISNALKDSGLNFEEELNLIKENINLIESKITDSVNEANLNLEQSLRSAHETLDLINSKVTEAVMKNDNSILEEGLEKLSETLEGIKGQIVSAPNEAENFIKEAAEKINAVASDIKAEISKTPDETRGIIEEANGRLKEKLDSLQADLSGLENKTENLVEGAVTSLKEKLDSLQADLSGLTGKTENVVESAIGELKGGIDTLRINLSDLSEKTENLVEDKINLISANSEVAESKISDLISQSNSDLRSAFNSVKEKIDLIDSKIAESKNEKAAALVDSLDDINRSVSSVLNSIENSLNEGNSNHKSLTELINSVEETIHTNENLNKKQTEETINIISSMIENGCAKAENLEEVKNSIIEALGEKGNENKANIQSKIEETAGHIHTNINSTRERVEEIKNELAQGAIKAANELKGEIEQVKAALGEQISNANSKNVIDEFSALVEQKVQDKISILEGLIDNCSLKFEEKAAEVLNENNENYKNSLNDRIDFAISQLKSDFEAKMTDIQKIVDDKVYEIVNRNNEIIKDELKLRADMTLKDLSKEFREKISKIESVLVKDEETEEGGEEASYTLADVESDIAKIRLGLERSNKLSNFKEFAARLVELKNINLENAKISRVIGADIMRFDSWLKNATAKIDLLAAKIEKSEKIKMEDLKTRLIQSEKNQAMPQKLEEAIMSIYKKYRTQETKIEEMINKVDSLSQKQSDTFDVKEFIDLFYDNNKKQENLISRMDGIEDKMDLIQAKIDHIISSCIDE